jgi:transcription initiation factor TFIIIB Brf1 subunit/transcription initiation factor TFIIB
MDFLEGKRPASIAAASLVFVLQMLRIEHKQQDVAHVASVSLNTLRNTLKGFTENIHKLPSHLFTLPNTSITRIF